MAADMKKRLDELLHDKKSCFTPILEKIEQKTGVKRLHIVLGVAAITSVWLMIGYGANILCNFLGFIYPAYASVKAIESTNKDDDTKWLTYWVVYSVFSLIEIVTDALLFWIPFYWFLKCVFLVYCMVPFAWNGSLTIYNRVVRPFVLRHEKQVDSTFESAANAARGFISEAEEIAREAVGDAVKSHMTKQE